MPSPSSTPPPASTPPSLKGVLTRLIDMQVLTPDLARAVAQRAQQRKISVQAYLFEQPNVPGHALAHALAFEFGLPWLDLEHFDLQALPQGLVNEQLVHKHRVLPLLRRHQYLYVAVSDPANTQALDELRFHTNLIVEPVIVDHTALARALEQVKQMGQAFPADLGGEGLEDLTIVDDGDEPAESSLENLTGNDDSPTVQFINKVIIDALRRGASDIHFEPYEDEFRVRFRLDGLLATVARAPIKLQSRLTTRLKVMAQLDIAERRVPQDGRMKVQLSKTRQMDFRVSTLPTLFGEKIVLRALDSAVTRMGIDQLGYEDAQKQLYIDTLAQPYGMILVTGPTGSGKTVSLYSGLNLLNTEARNISTAEDPVEIRVKGINQVQVNPKKGMTFAAALRSFLRQDPDVIMVGEIRDLETAEIAVKAAQTGHLVLSTLHTNDAPQAITRLMNMGIAPYNITASVSLVIAQRLARRLHSCKKLLPTTPQMLRQAGFTEAQIAEGITLYAPHGCPECNEGYKGRVGIYQVMPMTDALRALVLEGANAMQIAEASQREGIADLRQSALEKARQGVTSLAEVDRVTRAGG